MKNVSAKNLIPAILLIVLIAGLAVSIAYAASLKQRSEVSESVTPPSTETPGRVVVLRTAAPATPSPEPTIEPVPYVPEESPAALNAPFWSEGGILFDNAYKSPTLSVRVTTHSDSKTFGKRVVYYVADIFVSDVTQIRTAAYRGTFSRYGSGKVLDIARRENALIAISGDYYSARKESLIIRNGEIYRQRIGPGDICLLLRNGEMETIGSGNALMKNILEKDPWQAWQFGPSLLDDSGNARKSFVDNIVSASNPRSCIGYYEPGHYCFVMVDGRQKASAGLTLKELALLMQSLGCKVAYNLDGGASAHMYWQDHIFNNPSGGGRKISDIIYVAKESYPSARFFYGKAGQSE